MCSVLLDRQALAASNGSFAEGLYGLRRAAVVTNGSSGGPAGTVAAATEGEASSSSSAVGSRPLSPSQRHMSLVLLVRGGPDGLCVFCVSCCYAGNSLAHNALRCHVLNTRVHMPPPGLPLQTLVPFLRSKLDALHQQLQIQQQQPPRQGQAAAALGERGAGSLGAARRRLRAAALRAFLLLYPWAAAAHEGARFAYQLLYLLGRTPYYSPGLHLLGLQVGWPARLKCPGLKGPGQLRISLALPAYLVLLVLTLGQAAGVAALKRGHTMVPCVQVVRLTGQEAVSLEGGWKGCPFQS